MSGPEYALVEKPAVDYLRDLGYTYVVPEANETLRDGLNQVLFRDPVLDAIQHLNDVDESVAQRVYHELLTISDNERWTDILRGQSSRAVPGEATHRTIRLIDFLEPANNRFTVTNQFRVESQHPRVADLVVHVNGIPMVVIEAKKPGAGKLHSAFEQIKQYEEQIPRLFHSNAFNIVTDRHELRFGTTDADWAYWGEWRDPWPGADDDFDDDFHRGLWSLLEPSRLLDLLAHFIVFEREGDSGRVTKKMCRYQQYRAASKIVRRVERGEHSRGLIWHTQGSGKSLTMVFSVLKLKTHRTVESPELASPNILVVTDRKDLDRQISATFLACGLPNPKRMESMAELRKTVHGDVRGLTILSTIHKFEGSETPVDGSGGWIILVDEAHRTQEKDLGAFLRATFPGARYFGFTGTPVRKNDLDTFRNFSPPGETYLDRYDIDDAVRDGATVPIRYTSRKAEWHVDPARLDVLFDQWFADEPDDRLEAIKERGITIKELAKHEGRVELIAYDVWQHFKGHALPDGYKAQIVGIDREAVILYKRALDRVIAEELEKTEGLSPGEASARAAAMSRPVYSSNQDDAKPSEDPWVESVREDLRRWALAEQEEKDVIAEFKKEDSPLSFLIVCNKLLTGFDAPIESVMYLDSPLKDHNLLQAIARTNRVAGEKKRFGLIVDYIGITRKLDEALAAYRDEDVAGAMVDVEVERDALQRAHRELFAMIGDVPRHTRDLEAEYQALIDALGTEDVWFTFRRKADAFVRAYEALSPDPVVLEYREDLKWIVGFIQFATPEFEKEPPPDLTGVSEKIRRLLDEHLDVTGLRTVVKLRQITDPDFWTDFETDRPAEELRRATIRKATELKKVLREKVEANPLRYQSFSERVLEVIRKFEAGQLAAAEALSEFEEIAKEVVGEDHAYQGSGLNERAYGVLKILEAFVPRDDEPKGRGSRVKGSRGEGYGGTSSPDPVLDVARDIDSIYTSDETAPVGWHLKEQLRRELRQAVRHRAFEAGLEEVRKVAGRVEDYALRHYVKAL